MQWGRWSEEEGELSAQERLMALAAFKISTNLPLNEQEQSVQSCGLPLTETIALQKMVELFNYWQQLSDSLLPTPEPVTRPVTHEASPAQPPFDPLPYFYEGNTLPPPKSETPTTNEAPAKIENPLKVEARQSYELRRNGHGESNGRNGYAAHP